MRARAGTGADEAAQLGLGERMDHGEHLELVVVDVHAGDAQLLEIDVLSGPAVELEHGSALRAGHDRRCAPRDAAMRDADPDGRSTADGNGDHAVRQGAAVGETGAPGTPGGATGERDHSPGDRVRPGDDLGLVAGLGVDEQQQNGMRSVVDRGEGQRGCVVSSFVWVARLHGSDTG